MRIFLSLLRIFLTFTAFTAHRAHTHVCGTYKSSEVPGSCRMQKKSASDTKVVNASKKTSTTYETALLLLGAFSKIYLERSERGLKVRVSQRQFYVFRIFSKL